jgi:hypothetical protein
VIRNKGKINLNGGLFTALGKTDVRLKGKFNILSGGTFNGKNLNVFDDLSKFNLDGGIVNLDGSSTTTNAAESNIVSGTLTSNGNVTAGAGAGELKITGGILNANNLRALDSGIINLSGGTQNISNDLIIRNGGSYIQSGGTIAVDRYVTLQNQTAFASAELSGGQISAGNDLRFIGLDNTFTQTGGTFDILDDVLLNNVGSPDTGNVYNLNGGSLNVFDRVSLAAENTFNLTGGTLSVLDRILVADELSFNWSSSGVLKPYNTGIKIDYNGDLTAGSNAILDLENTSEYLDISGIFTLEGLIIEGYDLNLVSLKSEFVETGFYDLATANSIVLTSSPLYNNFTDSIANEIVSGASFNPAVDDVYWFDESIANSIRVNYSLAPIPEPSSISLIALGGLLLLGRRTRNR